MTKRNITPLSFQDHFEVAKDIRLIERLSGSNLVRCGNTLLKGHKATSTLQKILNLSIELKDILEKEMYANHRLELKEWEAKTGKKFEDIYYGGDTNVVDDPK